MIRFKIIFIKHIFLFLVVISTYCSNSYENQDDYDTNSYDNYEYESQRNTQEEDKQKLKEVCQSLNGVVDSALNSKKRETSVIKEN
jgi:hypothetical protein